MGDKKKKYPQYFFSLCNAVQDSWGGVTCYLSSETVSLFLPFLRRAASTFLPLAVDILLRKPCLFALFLSEGWNVLFIFLTQFWSRFLLNFGVAKVHKNFNMAIKKSFRWKRFDYKWLFCSLLWCKNKFFFFHFKKYLYICKSFFRCEKMLNEH